MFVINFFLGSNCIICDKKIKIRLYPQWICKKCLYEVIYIKEIFCKRCGAPYSNKCLCSFLSEHIRTVRSLIIYDSIGKELIHQWKYSGYIFVFDIFKKKLEKIDFSMYDGILSVPISFRKKIVRGFNQSNIISSFISKKYQIPDFSRKIIRKEAKPQMAIKSYKKRAENVKNIFKLKDNIECKNLLIVDDVITSCSTVNEITSELRKNNYTGNIDVFTLSMAI